MTQLAIGPMFPDDPLVEEMGLEPTTPCLQSRCSSQLSYTPANGHRSSYRVIGNHRDRDPLRAAVASVT